MNRLMKRRTAGVTIEHILSTMLGILVVFFAINIFHNSLKNVSDTSGYRNVFSKNEQKTQFEKYNRDYTNSQVDVQIVGEQGLGWYISQAEATINELAKKPQPLTDPKDQFNLAEALTKIHIAKGLNSEQIELYKNNEYIKINFISNERTNEVPNLSECTENSCSYTEVSGKKVYWIYSSSGANGSENENKIAGINCVQRSFSQVK